MRSALSMKKIILTFGLISGAVMSAMMVLTLPFMERIGDAGLLVGYATMVAASLAIYFGVRRYRDDVAGGSVSFGRAFLVGLAIALVAGACYTATWEVISYNFMPDFAERYSARQLERARAHGATAAELERKRAELAKFTESYHNPVYSSAMTFLEPLPVGLLVSLVSAGMLRRRRQGGAAGELAQVL
jgi:hypothetical protein